MYHCFFAATGPPANQGGMAAQLANVKLNKAAVQEAKPDARSDLLSEIRLGELSFCAW